MTYTRLALQIAVPSWLTLGVSASGCSSPYEAEPQFWPGDSQLGVGGSTAQAGSNGSTGGAIDMSAGGTQPSGTAGVMEGGTFGTAGAAAGSGGAGAGGMENGAGSSNAGGFGMAGGGSGSMGGASAGGSGGMTSGGTAGSGGMTSGGGGGSSSANCSLTVKVTTAAAGGRYAPRNIGAIWIADQSGNFIRSLEVWAQRRASNLSMWNSATSKAGVPGSRVDIVSQATLSTHVAHTSTWNCQDFNKRAVPDGTYRVYFEMTDQGNGGPNRFETFTKGGAPVTLKPADNNNFKAMELSFKP